MKAWATLEKVFFPYIASPSRYLGNEVFAAPVSADSTADFISLCFAGSYEESFNYPFYELLYRMGNDLPGVALERAFRPPEDARQRLQELGIPLFTVESRRPLVEGKAIVFYVPEYTHVPGVAGLLRLMGLPSWRSERGEAHPLVVAVIPWRMNGQVLRPLVDLLVCGECPVTVSWLVAEIAGAVSPRSLPGDYLQKNLPHGIRQVDSQENLAPVWLLRPGAQPASPVHFKPLIPFHNTRIGPDENLQFSAIGQGCSGCELGSQSHSAELPFLVRLSGALAQHLRHAGFHEFALYCQGGTRLAQQWWHFLKEQVLEANQSIQWDGQMVSVPGSSVGAFVVWLKQQEFYLGPLAASLKGRLYLNRFFRNEDLEQMCHWLVLRGWKHLRLVTLMGVPGDGAASVATFADFLGDLQQELRRLDWDHPPQISIQLEPWLPLPFTPYQWEGLPGLSRLAAIQQRWLEELTARELAVRAVPLPARLLCAWLSRADGVPPEVLEALDRSVNQPEQAVDLPDAAWKQGLAPLSVTTPLPWQAWMAGPGFSRLSREKRRLGSFTALPSCTGRVCLADGMERQVFRALLKGGKGLESPPPRQDESQGAERAVLTYGRRGRRREGATPPVRQRIRLRYVKQGSARFFSQADVARAFEIAARRARLALIYSRGKSPRPRFSFAPPLPIGLASVAEYLDLEVELNRPTNIQQQLNAYLPEGLQVVQYKTLFNKGPSLATSINLWEYEVYFDGPLPLTETQLQDWLNQSEIPWVRHTPQGPVTFDLRPFVDGAELRSDKLILWIRKHGDRMARITEVLDSLFGSAHLDYRQFFTQRTEQWIEGLDGRVRPLEVV